MTDRERLIRLLKYCSQYDANCMMCERWEEDCGDSRCVEDLLAKAAVALEQQKWIPVSERLPEEEELVLILCKNGARFVGYCGIQYADFERRWNIKTALNSTKLLNKGRVTHWMPLPEPPKEE